MSFVLALTDPHLPRGPLRLPHGVLDVVMLIDVSKSMLAEDYSRQSRLDKARDTARQFLSELQGNRVGVVTFAGNSFRQAELTEDFRTLDFILEHWVKEESSGTSGSDLSKAVETGLALFHQDSTREKLMVLFSDGGDHGTPLDQILTKARHRGVRIVIFGLGSIQPSRIPRYDAEHRFLGYLQIDGQVITTRLNETPLKQIASATKGRYWRVARRTSHLTMLTPESVVGSLLTQDRQKVFQPFLLAGLLACGMQLLIMRL